jgi:type IV pilus assembly protein PilN
MHMRINLLPTKVSRKKVGALYELVVMVVLAVMTVLGLYGWYWFMEIKKSDVQRQIADVQLQIDKLKKEVIRVDEFKDKTRNHEDKLKIIDDLKSRKVGPVHLLDDLATIITQVGDIWVLTLTERDGVMQLDMYSLSQDKISEFLDMLGKRSHYFTNIKLLFTEAKKEPENTLYHFKVTCSVQYGES